MKKDTVVSSKIVRTNKKNENLEAPSNDVSKMLKEITLDEPLSKENKKLHRRLFSQVKLMPASQINYFIKSSLFEDPENASKLLCMFLTAFKSTVDFDIKTVIFKAYLEVLLSLTLECIRQNWFKRDRLSYF